MLRECDGKISAHALTFLNFMVRIRVRFKMRVRFKVKVRGRVKDTVTTLYYICRSVGIKCSYWQ